MVQGAGCRVQGAGRLACTKGCGACVRACEACAWSGGLLLRNIGRAQCRLAKIKWSKWSSVPRVKRYASHLGEYGV